MTRGLDQDAARRWRSGTFLGLGIVGCLLACGCAQVPVPEQRLVSKPNMTFSDSLVFNYSNPLQAQIEPASEPVGGTQSSGCTTCK
jgi:hypothetical protein